MENRALNNQIPLYNPTMDGLIFISFLTNDVGLNLPNYNAGNFGIAVDNLISSLLAKGWPNCRIKFNVRYYINSAGLDYTSFNLGTKISDISRYNQFADILKAKLNTAGIQYFDHWKLLSSIPNPDRHLKVYNRHPDNFMHIIIAENILKNLKVCN